MEDISKYEQGADQVRPGVFVCTVYVRNLSLTLSLSLARASLFHAPPQPPTTQGHSTQKEHASDSASPAMVLTTPEEA